MLYLTYNISMNNKEVIMEPAQYAYYFMLRNYKTSKQIKFTKGELEKLLGDFFKVTDYIGYKFFDKNLNEIKKEETVKFIEEFSEEIIDCYAKKVAKYDNRYFFDKENIDKMRASYKTMSKGLKDAITDFETLCVYDAFFMENIYEVYENGYKSATSDFEDEVEDISYDA